jgi:integral membrane protein
MQMSEAADTHNMFLKNLRRMGFVEGVSTLILFGIAMPLKYMADMPLAVRVAGSLHGLLFMCLVVMLMMATTKVPISKSLALVGMLAAVVPFGPFVFDRWLVRDFDTSTIDP